VLSSIQQLDNKEWKSFMRGPFGFFLPELITTLALMVKNGILYKKCHWPEIKDRIMILDGE